MTGQASFAKEVSGVQHCDNGLSPRLREHRELHTTLLDVQHMLTRVALREDDIGSMVRRDPS
jgi:hypothetical protein